VTPALSLDDLRLRMKRWLAAGLEDATCPLGEERSHHLRLGGRSLAGLAEGMAEHELDKLVGFI
jgi:hypothetical protein